MKKLLIYVVTYNHESFIEKTLSRIDESLFDNYETEILVNDDSSKTQIDISIKLKPIFYFIKTIYNEHWNSIFS